MKKWMVDSPVHCDRSAELRTFGELSRAVVAFVAFCESIFLCLTFAPLRLCVRFFFAFFVLFVPFCGYSVSGQVCA